jgi:hypothetical protein
VAPPDRERDGIIIVVVRALIPVTRGDASGLQVDRHMYDQLLLFLRDMAAVAHGHGVISYWDRWRTAWHMPSGSIPKLDHSLAVKPG